MCLHSFLISVGFFWPFFFNFSLFSFNLSLVLFHTICYFSLLLRLINIYFRIFMFILSQNYFKRYFFLSCHDNFPFPSCFRTFSEVPYQFYKFMFDSVDMYLGIFSGRQEEHSLLNFPHCSFYILTSFSFYN